MRLVTSISSDENKRNRIMIFIPTYNCEKQIARVVAKFDPTMAAFIDEVVIIDNGSQDKTIAVAMDAVQKMPIKVTILKNDENYNLGGSIKAAFLYAINNNYDYVITLHGDDQADIREMIAAIKEGAHRSSQLLIGARFHPQSRLMGYSLFRRLGNRLLNLLCSIVTHRKIYDLIAGLNCFEVKFLQSKFFLLFPNNLTFDAHLLLYASDKKANINYFPITWREEDQISNAKVVKQAMIILRLFFSYLIKGKVIFTENKSGQSGEFTYPATVVFLQGKNDKC